MAVPKQRHTKSRRNKRRLHVYTSIPGLTKCTKCGKSVLPHTVCWNCGYYKGVEVLNVMEKLNKKEKKKREKEIRAQEREQNTSKPLSAEELSKQ
jgi:large subunit ribosomal protein L32